MLLVTVLLELIRLTVVLVNVLLGYDVILMTVLLEL